MVAKALIDQVQGGGMSDRRSLSRAISAIEDGDTLVREELLARFSATGKSQTLGITGPPGAGKSTIVDLLARNFATAGKKVAVLAIDPSSPFSGGALLGDRIRMPLSSAHPNIYIRSLASRGALGGLAPSVREIIFLLDLAQFDLVILETVGVGQAEVDIVRTADTVALVLVPGMGDGVQALKAGIIEIADIFVINKADYPTADQLQKELRTVLSLAPAADYVPAITRTIATEGKGVEELVSAIADHRAWAEQSGALMKRREEFLKQAFREELQHQALAAVYTRDSFSERYAELEKRVCQRVLSPTHAARDLLRDLA